MSFFYRFFKWKQDEDYETVLSSLAQDIQKRRVQLSEIRLRERRSTLLVTLYTLAGWVAYVSMWYTGVLPNLWNTWRGGRLGKSVADAPVVVGPIIILFIRRIVQIWYKSKGDAEEKTLQILMKRQKLKVDEIKKKTNYESTRELIQRYEAPITSTQRSPLPQPVTPQKPIVLVQGQSGLSMPNSPHSSVPSPHVTPHPALIPRKQWFDKLVDAVLGDDDHTPSASTSRYALICEKCFAHNGLVKESMWEDAQYICPKCNHFNISFKAKQARLRSPSASPKPISNKIELPSLTPTGSQQKGRVERTPPTTDTNLIEVDSI